MSRSNTPEWIRKSAIASVVAALLEDPETYLTATFGLQPRAKHITDLADMLFAIATDSPDAP